jgi:hypothetical protein
MQALCKLVNIDVISREKLHFDTLGTVFKTTFSIGHAPQTDEQQPCLVWQFCQKVVFEE